MPRDFAAFSALRASREAIAAISLQSPFCMPGMTFFTAMDATPSTPHFTLPCFTAPPCDSSTLPFITQLGQLQYFECLLDCRIVFLIYLRRETASRRFFSNCLQPSWNPCNRTVFRRRTERRLSPTAPSLVLH